MKFSYASRMMLVVIAVLLTWGYLGMAWVSAENEQWQGKDQISKTQALLRKADQQNMRPLKEVQGLIDSAVAGIKKIEDSYPAAIDEAAVMARLLDMADANRVRIYQMTNQEAGRKTDLYLYPMATITVRLDGTYTDLLRFVFDLEASRADTDPKALPPFTVDQTNFTAKPGKFDAEIMFSIYAKPAALPKPVPGARTTTTSSKPK